MVEEEEYNRVRALLFAKTKKEPNAYEVLKAAKSITPPPEILEKRVLSVLHTCMEKDLELDRQQTIGTSSKNEKRFFKPGALTLNTIVNQMEHVKKGCLSDPASTVFPVHRHNQTTQKTYTARGTGGNEAAWRYINRILDTPAIGLSRADQVINNYFEADNDKKRVSRLGEKPEETSRTEQLQALHRLASKCGFKDDEIPVASINFPTAVDSFVEHIGFEQHLPMDFNVDDVRDNAEDDDSAADLEDLADFLRDVAFTDNDGTGTDPTEENSGHDNARFAGAPGFEEEAEVDLTIYTPIIMKNERTYDRFTSLSKEQPWVPFRDPKDAHRLTELDQAEISLFDELEPNYDRNAKSLSSAKGYKTFAKAWNFHVGNLFSQKLAGDNSVVIINRKSTVQLQQHYDQRKRQKELRGLMNKSDPLMQRLEKDLRETRKEMTMTPHQTTATCQPVRYNPLGHPQFGVPCALNTEIAANAFQHNGSRTLFHYKQPGRMTIRTSRDVLGKSFRAKAYCWRCGFSKKEHLRAGRAFGADCSSNCGHEECSKCYCRITFDDHANGRIGPHCSKDPHPTRSKYYEWGMTDCDEETQTGVM